MTKFFCNRTWYNCGVCCDLNDHVKRSKADAEEIKNKFPCMHDPKNKPHWLVVGGKYESG